ncbi:MAG: lysophospholipid acyltransferase family protein [Candidatus Omnitrophota bacterium]
MRFYRISRRLLKLFMMIFFKFRIYGRENIPEPPYLAVSNHVSLLDPPLVGVACEKDNMIFMAKKELFDKPVLGAWTRSVGCIRVDRDGNSTKSIRTVLECLNAGKAVSIFPEGERSTDGELKEAKRGAGFIIAKAGVPVVPIYISGTMRAFPKGGRMRPGTEIKVFVGRPITPEDPQIRTASEKKDYTTIANIVMERIARAELDNEGARSA